MSHLSWAVLLATVAACGARTDLGAPSSPSGPGDGDGNDATPHVCNVSNITPIAETSAASADVHLTSSYVYFNDGSHLMRVPKSGGAPEVVVTAVIDVGAYDVDASGAVFVAHGKAAILRADGKVLGDLPSSGTELLAISNDVVYAIAPTGVVEGLYAAANGVAKLVASLPFSVPELTPKEGFTHQAFGLVAFGDTVYVAFVGFEPFPSQIVAVDAKSGSITTLLSAPLSVPGTSLVLDGDYVYFASFFGPDGPGIRRISKSGGGSASVTPTPTYCASCAKTLFAADDKNVYFSDGELGERIEAWSKKDGSEPTTTTPKKATHAVTGLASDGRCIYWTAANERSLYAAPVQ